MPSLRFFSTDSSTDVSMAWIFVVFFLIAVGYIWHRYETEEHVWVHVKTPHLRGKMPTASPLSPHFKHITIAIHYGDSNTGAGGPPPLDLSATKLDDTETKKTV